MDKLRAPDQEAIERELRDLFDYGDIKEVASEARIPYSTLTKQLNPDCIEESIVYQLLMFLHGCRNRRPELEEAVWSLIVRHRPRSDKAVTAYGLDAAWFNYRKALAEREDGGSLEDVEKARDRLIEVVGRYGAAERQGIEIPS